MVCYQLQCTNMGFSFRSYSCIDAVHNKAVRFFLGVGKYTPNDAVSGEMAWKPTSVRQWKSMFLYWSKLSAMGYSGLNKRIALWASEKSSRSCKNWLYSVSQFLIATNFGHYANITEAVPSSHRFIADLENILFENFVTTWLTRINSNVGPSGRGRNKPPLYKTFKQNYSVENYCKTILPVRHRAAFSKFRCGVAPIRIETGRYEGLTEDLRLCPFCNVLENEMHVILSCQVYDDLREPLLTKALNCEPNFYSLSEENQFVLLFSSPDLVRICVKSCVTILQRRHILTCK